jgi:hypothetical protein
MFREIFVLVRSNVLVFGLWVILANQMSVKSDLRAERLSL